MGKKSTPKPPDLSGYTDALQQQGEFAYLTSQEQLKWAREQDANNRTLLQQVLTPQLEAQQNQAQWAQQDRARYENVYQPLEDNLVKDFQSYGTPERVAAERGRAMADVSTSFDAQRRNALQRLEGFGVDPSQTRNAALDVGMRTAQAAATAGAGTNSTRLTEDKARALRADAINIGRGLPSQVANSYNQSVQAGATAMGGANQTFGTGASAMGNPTSWGQMGQSGIQGAGNMATQGFNNQMTAYNAQQQANASLYSGIGSAVGMAAMMADGGVPPDQAIPTPGMIADGPGDGSGIDDQVPAKIVDPTTGNVQGEALVSTGEYIVPADVVRAKGVEFFDKLLERYHTPAAQQQQQGIPA
jgi:hypothetical protein